MLYGVEAQNPVAGAGNGNGAAAAVHFSAACLNCTSLAATDNSFFSFSFWLNGSICGPFTGAVLWQVDYGTNYVPTILASVQNTMKINAGHNAGPGKWWKTYATTSGWHHYLGSVETNQATGARKNILYIDDVLASATATTDTGTAFNNQFNGKSFAFGDEAPSGFSPIATDVADVWIAPGVQLHSGTTIPDATRRQFTDMPTGGPPSPLDPATFPTSAILFYGNAASFATNHGTGGSFTLTGSLTDAATNP
jgi:hypothetical protein